MRGYRVLGRRGYMGGKGGGAGWEGTESLVDVVMGGKGGAGREGTEALVDVVIWEVREGQGERVQRPW